jgi:hypothetical protein
LAAPGAAVEIADANADARTPSAPPRSAVVINGERAAAGLLPLTPREKTGNADCLGRYVAAVRQAF